MTVIFRCYVSVVYLCIAAMVSWALETIKVGELMKSLVSQSKHIYIALYVASESEVHELCIHMTV